jgi:hypothetical protein
MQITVLNGSPKGMTSVTMQYVLFLQKKHPKHEFRILNICHDIKNLEDNPRRTPEHQGLGCPEIATRYKRSNKFAVAALRSELRTAAVWEEICTPLKPSRATDYRR